MEIEIWHGCHNKFALIDLSSASREIVSSEIVKVCKRFDTDGLIIISSENKCVNMIFLIQMGQEIIVAMH
jgi:hypothetical protein